MIECLKGGLIKMKNYKPATEDEELIAVLGMRLYDIINKLGSQLMKKKDSDCEYIQFKALNGLNNEDCLITVSVQRIE